jgi:hypothetical protein
MQVASPTGGGYRVLAIGDAHDDPHIPKDRFRWFGAHAAAIKAWGAWIPVAWPHDGLQHDKGSGEQLAAQFRAQGLQMMQERATFEDGSSGVEAGVMEMLDRMRTGRWKVFASCEAYLDECLYYHRKDGLIVKERDDLLSASRYALMMKRLAVTKPRARSPMREKRNQWAM